MFYNRLEALCNEHGMSVAEACQMAGLHRSTHSMWKSGTQPSKRSVVKMANILGTTPEYLLDGVKPDAAREDEGYVKELLSEVSKMGAEGRDTLLAVARGINNQAGGKAPVAPGQFHLVTSSC